jgi:hypothetical protein
MPQKLEMATITITGTTATETLTGWATMTDTDFANVLAAYKIIGRIPAYPPHRYRR